MQTGDRNALNGLFKDSAGVHLSSMDLSDASRSPISPEQAWTQKPQLIHLGQERLEDRVSRSSHIPPSTRNPAKAIPNIVNGQRRVSTGSNPYNMSRFQNTLSNRSVPVGNFVAKQTVFPDLRPTKRQRTDSGRAGVNYKRHARAPIGADAEIIDLEADSEDIGQPVPRPPSSPDPLNSFGGGPSDVRNGKLREDIIDDARLPADGPHTRRLQRKFAEHGRQYNSEDESIEDADGFDNETSFSKGSTSNHTSVREKVNFFDQKAKPQIPNLDLGKLVKGMKSKQPNLTIQNHMLRSKQKDSIATSSTKFTRKSAGGKSALAKLPIEAWYLGTKRLPENDGVRGAGYTLQLHGLKMTIKNEVNGVGNHRLEPAIDRDLDQFEYSQEVAGYTVWKFGTTDGLAEKKRTNKPNDQLLRRHFVPGSKGADGTITIKFRTEDSDFEANYKDLTSLVCKSIEDNAAVSEAGAKGLWEMSQRNLDFDVWSSGNEAQTSGKSLNEVPTKKPTRPRQPPSPPEVVTEELELRTSDARTRVRNKSSTVVEESDDVVPVVTIRPRPRPRPKPTQEVAENASLGLSILPRRSARHVTPVNVQPPLPIDSDELILVYPPDGPGAVNITRADLSRLRPDEFLNDTLIEFGLKLMLNELRAKDPEFAESIHVFSSFFYKKLNKKNLEEGYQSIRKWTLKVDLFKKKYIIIPINENLHWYLAIILGPEHFILPSTAKTPTRGRAAHIPVQEPPKFLDRSPLSPRVSHPASPSETQGEAEVEAILNFRSSCSITTPEDDARTISGSPSVEGNTTFAEIQERVAVEGIQEARYDSPLSDDMMDVDQPEVQSVGSSRSVSEIALPNDRRKSSDVEIIPSHVDHRQRETGHSRAGEHGSGRLDLDDNDVVIEDALPLLSKHVEPASFYAPTPTRHNIGRSTYTCRPQEKGAKQAGRDDEIVDEPAVTCEASEKTYIFTLDSLGSQHRHVINTLRSYLKMEAKDKLNITETGDLVGRRASVPVQPNHCDCGIYLLHFARTFMMDPVRYSQTILSSKPSADRQADWKQEDIGGLRDRLTAQIIELSEHWRIQRAAKEEQKKKDAAEGKEAEKVESSDSEIDIVEDIQGTVQSVTNQKAKTRASRVR